MRRLLFEAKDLASESNRIKKTYGNKIFASMMNNEHNKRRYDRGDVDEAYMLNVALRYFQSCCPDTEDGQYASAYLEWVCVKWIKRTHAWKTGSDYSFTTLLRNALEVFDTIKKKNLLDRFGLHSDIFKYTEDNLVSTISQLSSGGGLVQLSPNQRVIDKLGDACEVAADFGDAIIYAVYTWEADRTIGGTTEWCTVANKNYYEQYSPVYYILCPKDGFGAADIHSKNRFQFHYEDDYVYIMDVNDNDAEWETVGDCYGAEVANAIFNTLSGHDRMYGHGMDLRMEEKRAKLEKINNSMYEYYGVSLSDILDKFTKNVSANADIDINEGNVGPNTCSMSICGVHCYGSFGTTTNMLSLYKKEGEGVLFSMGCVSSFDLDELTRNVNLVAEGIDGFSVNSNFFAVARERGLSGDFRGCGMMDGKLNMIWSVDGENMHRVFYVNLNKVGDKFEIGNSQNNERVYLDLRDLEDYFMNFNYQQNV